MKMCVQNASYLVQHSQLRVKFLTKFFLKIVQKALKMAITLRKFSKTFRGSMPPYPTGAVFVSQLARS